MRPPLDYDESESVEDMLSGRWAAAINFIASPQFMVGWFAGLWFAVGAAFVVAFA